VAAALAATSCSDGGGGGGGLPIADSPGAGTATLAVRGTIEARDVVVATSTLYTTDFSVEVWSDVNRAFPVSGATVGVTDSSGAVTALKEDLPGRPGRYTARILGYPGSFIMNVNAGALGSLNAAIVGSPIHTVSLSQPQPIAVNAATTVTWSPSGETSCERQPDCVDISYNGLNVGPAPLFTADDGSFALPALGAAANNWLATEPGRSDEERIEVTRNKRIRIDADDAPPGGALAGSGSFLDVSVRVRTGRLDTTDTRVNSIAGSVDDPTAGPCANPAGDVVIAAWPSSNPDPIDVASAVASATVLDAAYGGTGGDVADPFTLGNLEPWPTGAGYVVRAWVDADGNGRLDSGECYGEPAAGVTLAPAPAAGADVGLLTLDTQLP
jgi:hypothetical protein